MSDLPEPKRRFLSEEEKKERKWRLDVAFLFLVAAYSSIHKLIVPLGLKFTNLSSSPYAVVDFWAFHPFILWWLLRRDRRVTPLSAFLCGAGVIYGVYEWYLIAHGDYEGWLAVSRFVASSPFALLCISIMAEKESKSLLRFAWLGALVLIFLLVLFQWKRGEFKPDVLEPRTDVMGAPVGETDWVLAHQSECGARQLKVDSADLDKLPKSQVIEVSDCGFSPSAVVLNNGSLTLRNRLSNPVNFHLTVFDGQKKRQAWNVALTAGETKQMPVVVDRGSVGVLYSDSAPQSGLVVVMSGQLNGVWFVSRSPLRVWEAQ